MLIVLYQKYFISFVALKSSVKKWDYLFVEPSFLCFYLTFLSSDKTWNATIKNACKKWSTQTDYNPKTIVHTRDISLVYYVRSDQIIYKT